MKKRKYYLYRLVFRTYPGIQNCTYFRTLTGCIAHVAVALRRDLFNGLFSRPFVYRAEFDRYDSVGAFEGEDITEMVFRCAENIVNSKSS